jgi:hypothetical protein
MYSNGSQGDRDLGDWVNLDCAECSRTGWRRDGKSRSRLVNNHYFRKEKVGKDFC